MIFFSTELTEVHWINLIRLFKFLFCSQIIILFLLLLLMSKNKKKVQVEQVQESSLTHLKFKK